MDPNDLLGYLFMAFNSFRILFPGKKKTKSKKRKKSEGEARPPLVPSFWGSINNSPTYMVTERYNFPSRPSSWVTLLFITSPYLLQSPFSLLIITLTVGVPLSEEAAVFHLHMERNKNKKTPRFITTWQRVCCMLTSKSTITIARRPKYFICCDRILVLINAWDGKSWGKDSAAESQAPLLNFRSSVI